MDLSFLLKQNQQGELLIILPPLPECWYVQTYASHHNFVLNFYF